MRVYLQCIGIFCALFCYKSLFAQTDFYDTGTIQEIRIYFDNPDWDTVLDSLYVEGENNRLKCDVEINGTLITNVGIRYKGFSSVSTNRIKNPFNIDLDYYYDYQDYEGIQKIKLSNVIQDPSFVREVLSYEIARDYMPASQSNYANVYINDTLWGLYSNVEAVNGQFLENHFGEKTGTFFKCNPEDLDLSGENANLSLSPGTDSIDYHPYYTLKSDYGWSHLYQLIDTLNNFPEEIEEVLNVDQTLWMHAFNYTLVNFDSYIGYAQNYYLYRDKHGIFQPIIWDLNMSFGSYRFSDASEYWSGFNIAEAKIIDPLSHHNTFSVYPRPLLRNLFQNDTYRRMFLAHIRTMVEEQFANQHYRMRGQTLQTLVDQSVANDTNKFYGYDDFLENLDTTVSDLIEYPGITDLMEDRAAYLSSYPGFQGAPSITVPTIVYAVYTGDSLLITSRIMDADSAILAYRFEEGGPYRKVPMWDDGNHGDGGAGDQEYGAWIKDLGAHVQYYLYAENDSAGVFLPRRAAYESFEWWARVNSGELVINEVDAATHSTLDPAGEPADWIELYNPNKFPINTIGLSLTYTGDSTTQWLIPGVTIPGYGFMTLWADKDLGQSGFHLPFTLDADAGTLHLGYAFGKTVDELTYTPQNSIATWGRYPDGAESYREMFPTQGRQNKRIYGGFLESDLFVYPNPASDEINIQISLPLPYEIEVMTAEGKSIRKMEQVEELGVLTWDTQNWLPGIYLIRVTSAEAVATQKIMIIE